MVSSGFMLNFKNIRKPGTYNWSDKRCKICQSYSNETNKFTMSNRQVWKNCREIDYHSVNVIHYLECKMCSKKKHVLGKQ